MQIDSQDVEVGGGGALEIVSDSLKSLVMFTQGELLEGCADALSDYMHVHPFALSRSAKGTMSLNVVFNWAFYCRMLSYLAYECRQGWR